jgi:hypothetical protein
MLSIPDIHCYIPGIYLTYTVYFGIYQTCTAWYNPGIYCLSIDKRVYTVSVPFVNNGIYLAKGIYQVYTIVDCMSCIHGIFTIYIPFIYKVYTCYTVGYTWNNILIDPHTTEAGKRSHGGGPRCPGMFVAAHSATHATLRNAQAQRYIVHQNTYHSAW